MMNGVTLWIDCGDDGGARHVCLLLIHLTDARISDSSLLLFALCVLRSLTKMNITILANNTFNGLGAWTSLYSLLLSRTNLSDHSPFLIGPLTVP